MTDEPVHLSVVIPAFKEEARIVPTLDRVREYLDLQPYRSEVLVVVDGGVDAKRLYDEWAKSYDEELVEENEYVAPRRMAAIFAKYFSD